MHEDGIVISETAAKKLTSQHMYVKEIESNDDITIDKNRYIKFFPSKITPTQMRKLDKDGIAMKGTTVEKGDFVITALCKRDLTQYDTMLTKLRGALANPYKDISETWDHDRPGLVTDVVRNGNLVKVILTTEDETRVGDKLCYSPDTEVLTKRGWILFPELTMDDEICCLDPETDNLRYDKPSLVDSWDHDGDMYHLDTASLNFMITPDHYTYTKSRYDSNFKLVQAKDVYGKRVEHKKNAIWNASDVPTFTLPGVEHKHAKYRGEKVIPMDLWLEFLGYYVSEGSSHAFEGNNSVTISQSKKAHPEAYDKMCANVVAMGFVAHKRSDSFVIHNKQLYSYCVQLGKSYEKRLPRYTLDVSRRQSLILLEALMLGDGSWGSTGTGLYTSTSSGLCDDVQELLLKCGYAGTVTMVRGARVDIIKGKPYDCRPIWTCSVMLKYLTPEVNHGHVSTQSGQLEEYLNYTGKVYCCTVPTHVLYVRRHGKAAFSGNTGIHGNKGTVTLILPDHTMPHDANKEPVDMLLNPAGVISRVNPGQLYEAMAGKIARKTGKPYIVDNFSPEDSSKLVLKHMKENGITPEEPLFDAKTGRKLGDVFVGVPYITKLHKQTEGNFAARFTKGYDVNLQPSKGGEEGAKAIGLQDVYALLGHNARANLHEMASYKSQKNEDFWDAIKIGLPTPPAKEPFAFEKFKALIGAAGIHVQRDKEAYTIAPLSDKHILAQSNGSISSGALLTSSLGGDKEELGGLFDPMVTGGKKGTQWSHMDLAEPVVNPMFAAVVKVLLEGKDLSSMKPAEIKAELSKINVPQRLATIRTELGTAKGSPRNKLLKELRYLTALQKIGMKPEDYVLNKFPIIPPQFRPIYPSQSGGAPMISDLNLLYRDMINVNNELGKLKDFPETDTTKVKLRSDLQQAAGAIVGIMKPVNKKNEKQEIKGIIPVITGGNLDGGGTSKESYFHKKLMKRNQDLTGRGTILPDPDLHVDYAKIPIDMAHMLYKPFVINNLVKKGMSPLTAAQHVADRTIVASRALDQELERRPIILNRAPTLHKYNMLALKPIAVEGKSIFIPPLIIKGFSK